MKKFWKSIFNVLDDVLAYVLTLLCVIFSNVVSALQTKEVLFVDISLVRIIGSALVELLLTLWQEYNKPDETGSKEKSKEGKKKHFLKRMIYAMLFGFGSPMIMEKLLSLINIG